MEKPFARIITLGCRLNHADSALLCARLEKLGYTLTDDPKCKASLIIVNGCAVTAEAEAKTRRQIARLHRENPDAEIIAAGCAAELDPERLLAAGAAYTLTNPDKKLLGGTRQGIRSSELEPENFLEKSNARFPFRSRAFIKVQEGCDNHCTYCIVPTVRGPSRSRDFDEAVADCRSSIEAGFPEIILTGVNTCAYSDHGKNFTDLIRKTAAIPGNFRIRLSSTEPHPGDMSLPELIASEQKLCRFLHLSVQHGSNRILQAMNRRYTIEQFAEFASNARKAVPDIHIGTDFIVGFPGETEKDFSEALTMIKAVGFANIHGFVYSRRPGTPAADMPGQVHPQAAAERMTELRKAAAESASAFARSQYGKELPVIFERISGGIARGWSDNYLQIQVPADGIECRKITVVTGNEKNIIAHNDDLT